MSPSSLSLPYRLHPPFDCHGGKGWTRLLPQDPVQWNIADDFFRLDRVILDLLLFGRYGNSEDGRQASKDEILRRMRPAAAVAIARGAFDRNSETHRMDVQDLLPAAEP